MTDEKSELARLRDENARLREAQVDLEARARRTEAELEQSRALLEAAIESLPFDFWARDRDGYCFLQNATTERNWGDLRHKRPEDMDLPPDVVETWLANNRRALAGEIVRGDVDYELDGETRHVQNVLAPIQMGDAIVGTLGVNIDVTDLKRAAQALREAQKLEAVGQLTAGVAHNFNNMLMGILPNLDMAARDAPPRLAGLLHGARDSAMRAAELVRQLMTYAGRNRPAEHTVQPIATIVGHALDVCRTTFDRGISIEQSLDRRAQARVDAVQIEQAVLNLLINARDALSGSDAPRLEVAVDVVPAGATELAGRPGDWVRIRVADDGAGITPETMARIFDPFFTTKEVGKGTGLGLATTQAIAREHGGFVSCESVAGRGATFCIYVPLDRSEPAPSPESPPGRATATGGHETILLVDDEPAVRRVVAQILTDAGYVVGQASSGQVALDHLADPAYASRVRLLILDVSMPGLPSHVLRQRLRELVPHARVLYFTGYALEAGDVEDPVMEKPVTRERLLATVRAVLDAPGAGARKPQPG